MRNPPAGAPCETIPAVRSAGTWVGSRPLPLASAKSGRCPVPPWVRSRTRPGDDAHAAEVVVAPGPAPHQAAAGLQLLERTLVDPGLRVHDLRSRVEARPGDRLRRRKPLVED